MLRHRTLVLGLLSVLGAVVMLARVGSDASAAPRTDGQNICNDQESQGEEEVCQENGEQRQCVSLCRDIQPIFDNRCINCHNPVTTRGGLDLTAGNSYANLVNQPTSPACMMTAPDSVRVVPSCPPSSMLWLKLRPDDGRCGRPMPFGTDGLGVIAPDEFALIEAWIAQGARNN